jgi:type IV pilus assembly protein PilF
MKRLAIAATAGLLLSLFGGCTTTETNPDKTDLKEAARLNTQLGIDYMRKGQYELALEKLKRALEQDNGLATTHSTIALLYQRRGEAEQAEEHYREALDLNADDPGTLNNFGIFLCAQGDVADAEKAFLKAAQNRENRNPADAWANAGVCVRRDPKKLAKAEDYFREALKLNNRHPNALAQMAAVSYDRQDYLRARAFLQRYESVAKATPQTLWLGAQTERKLGDLQTARGYERRLRTEFPEAPETDALTKQSGRR